MSASFRGFLVVNAFLNSSKFGDIYHRLCTAFDRVSTRLEVYTNAELLSGACFEKCAGYDFCVFWDKDVRLAASLEDRGVRVFNPSAGIEACDSKLAAAKILAGAGVAMPDTVALPFTYDNVGYTDLSFVEELESRFGYPFVIKADRGSFGAQVYLATDRKRAVEILLSLGGKAALAQEFIRESSGRDIRINMVGSRMAAAMERYNENDFRANITAGGSMKKYTPTPMEKEMAARVMDIMKLDFAGVDILFSHRGPLLCEVNSNPHFKSIYECTGVNVADEIAAHVLGVLSG